MDAIIQELDRLREETKRLREEVDVLTRKLQNAERAAELSTALERSLGQSDTAPEDISRDAYLKGILAPGTPVYNRHYLAEELEREFRRNTRKKSELCCVLLGPNDPEEQLDMPYLAELLHNHLRIEDVLGVWSANLFMLVLSRTQADTALALSDYLRSLLAEADENACQTSAGIADLKAGMPRTPAEVLQNATEALQLAREMGGSRSIVFNRMPV